MLSRIVIQFKQRLDTVFHVFPTFAFSSFLFFFSFWKKCISALPVGLMHCSRDSQISFFTQTFIKNGSHDTIHTFKNYFVTVFSVFSKISGIQTDS